MGGGGGVSPGGASRSCTRAWRSPACSSSRARGGLDGEQVWTRRPQGPGEFAGTQKKKEKEKRRPVAAEAEAAAAEEKLQKNNNNATPAGAAEATAVGTTTTTGPRPSHFVLVNQRGSLSRPR